MFSDGLSCRLQYMLGTKDNKSFRHIFRGSCETCFPCHEFRACPSKRDQTGKRRTETTAYSSSPPSAAMPWQCTSTALHRTRRPHATHTHHAQTLVPRGPTRHTITERPSRTKPLAEYQTPSAAPPKSIERLSRVTPPTTSVALGASLSDVPIGSKAHQRPLPPQYLQGR